MILSTNKIYNNPRTIGPQNNNGCPEGGIITLCTFNQMPKELLLFILLDRGIEYPGLSI
jgi:hypothetical protein